MSNHITITPATGTWVVRAGGAVLGETQNALSLVEGTYEPVIYFPRADIAMAFLDTSEKSSHCPHKGDASYFSIQTKSQLLKDAVWTYEAPLAAVTAIKDHLAFQGENIAVEQV